MSKTPFTLKNIFLFIVLSWSMFTLISCETKPSRPVTFSIFDVPMDSWNVSYGYRN